MAPSDRAQLVPALQGGHQFVFDLGAARRQLRGASPVGGVKAAVGELVVDRLLFQFQGLDQPGQAVQLALLLVTELALGAGRR